MCWISRNTENKRKKIATEDIPVFKIVNYNTNSGKICAYYRHCEYTIGETYGGNHIKPIKMLDEFLKIENGFHSYSNSCIIIPPSLYRGFLVESKMHVGIDIYYGNDIKLMRCIIPQGTEYYENENGEIVSEKLKTVNVEEIKQQQ